MRPRRAHVLRGAKTAEMPTQFIFMDTETREVVLNEKETEHILRLGCAKYVRLRSERNTEKEERKIVFYTSEQFWDWVEEVARPKARVIMFCHNTQFDFAVVKGFTLLKQLGWTIAIPIIDSHRFIARFRKQGKTLLILDTMNYFTTSLKIVGEAVGVGKLEMPAWEASDDEWITYCWRDVDVIEEFIFSLLNFIERHNLGNFGITAARQAMNAFTFTHMKHDIYIHDATDVLDLEIKSYYGGRCEAFRLGEIPWSPVIKIDINSMYPYVMKQFSYPTRFVKRFKDPSLSDIEKMLKEGTVIALCGVETDIPLYPKRLDNRLCFPVGRFAVFLAGPELEEALHRGHLIKVGRAAFYETAPIFTDYVDNLYSLRKTYESSGEIKYALIAKLLLNSLYGKFGQRSAPWVDLGETSEEGVSVLEVYSYEDKRFYRYVTVGGKTFVEGERQPSFDAFPAIAATVTSHARLYLWKMIELAGLENVAYVDTDSLMTNETGMRNVESLISLSELGRFKIETISDTAQIFGLKDYIIGQTTFTKGIRANATKIADNRFEQTQSLGFRGSLRKGIVDRVIWRKTEKLLARNYRKGVLMPDGRVLPLELPQAPEVLRWI